MSFVVRSFTSKKFTSLFLTDGVPAGLTASIVNQSPNVLRRFIRNVKRAFTLVNETSRFSVVGWIRKGTVVDDALDATTSSNDKARVLSSETTYHLTNVGINGCNLDGCLTNLSSEMATEGESVRASLDAAIGVGQDDVNEANERVWGVRNEGQ
jgi:hypothetical protein